MARTPTNGGSAMNAWRSVVAGDGLAAATTTPRAHTPPTPVTRACMCVGCAWRAGGLQGERFAGTSCWLAGARRARCNGAQLQQLAHTACTLWSRLPHLVVGSPLASHESNPPLTFFNPVYPAWLSSPAAISLRLPDLHPTASSWDLSGSALSTWSMQGQRRKQGQRRSGGTRARPPARSPARPPTKLVRLAPARQSLGWASSRPALTASPVR